MCVVKGVEWKSGVMRGEDGVVGWTGWIGWIGWVGRVGVGRVSWVGWVGLVIKSNHTQNTCKNTLKN